MSFGEAISANLAESDQRFAWQMIEPHLEACQFYVSSSEILNSPANSADLVGTLLLKEQHSACLCQQPWGLEEIWSA